MQNVRLKRYLDGEEKIGNWQWHKNPISGTREINGLRVMMAVINNSDLKDENNSIYEEKDGEGERVLRYRVSDVGGSFGTTGLCFGQALQRRPARVLSFKIHKTRRKRIHRF
jgi:hypothetical protein